MSLNQSPRKIFLGFLFGLFNGGFFLLLSQGDVRKIKFCQWCGGPTKHEIPDGEEKLRAICTHCDKIAYQNPKMVLFGFYEQCLCVVMTVLIESFLCEIAGCRLPYRA